jgi:DNA-binding PadR family transcriptional regulator
MKKRGCIFKIKTWDILEGTVLSLLLNSPSHGYSLIEQISEFGISPELLTQGVIYRILRSLETKGFISSGWETEGTGAARRVYKITPAGKKYLEQFINIEKKKIEHLNEVFKRIEFILNNKS